MEEESVNKKSSETKAVGKRPLFAVVMVAMTLVLSLAVGEILIRLVEPHHSMYPRWDYSAEYGLVPFRSTQMVHERPGHWSFTYTLNQHGHRGAALPVSNVYPKKNVVVLGDSYTFGLGVNDGEEYPAVMRAALHPDAEVVNLGVAAWGLTQEVRRYYEFGQLYSPEIVVLQFTSNDPEDNLTNPVTTVEHGRFVFKDSNNSINWVKKYLSRSILQKSQIYNLFRDAAYLFFQRRVVSRNVEEWETEQSDSDIFPAEDFHIELLEAFTADLTGRGVTVIMISVDDHLDEFPSIKKAVEALDSRGTIEYFDTRKWLEGVTGYESLEGHEWGAKAHQVIGTRLAEIIRAMGPVDAVALARDGSD